MTDSDPLARWRRQGDKPTSSEAAAAAPAAIAYEPFTEADRPPRIHLRRSVMDANEGPAYGYLGNITTDENTIIGLNYPSLPLVVVIHGENLAPLVSALMKDSVAMIQQYDVKRFTEPAPGSPVIREIEVHRTRPAEEEPAKH